MTLRLYDSPAQSGPRRHGSCCAPEDIDDARRVAEQLEIPFYVLEASERFRNDVIDPFVAAYREGRTPLPCAACNRSLKFGHLLDRARALSRRGCAPATTRASSVAPTAGIACCGRATNGATRADFLFGLRQEDLAQLEFPLGDLLKSEVRTLAAERRLRVAGEAR